jgi:hypothetical protein
VGINTTPAETFHVVDTTSEGGVLIDNTATDGNPILAFGLSGTKTFTMGVDDGDSDKFKIFSGAAIDGTSEFVIDGSGNVGIGTASPASKLDVQSGNITAVFGADGNAETLTDNTNKAVRLAMPHYDTDQEPGLLLLGYSNSGEAGIDFGGGTSTTNAATILRFFTAANTTTLTGTKRVDIDSSGNITAYTGNLVIGTAGKGIDFSAQTSPGAGMTSELLDRYEEGTWTAIIKDTNDNLCTMVLDTGQYNRIGNKVTVTGIFSISSLGSASGTIRIAGLPFAVTNDDDNYSAFSIGWATNLNITINQSISGGYFDTGTSSGIPQIWNAATGTSSMTAVQLSADGTFIMEGSYLI